MCNDMNFAQDTIDVVQEPALHNESNAANTAFETINDLNQLKNIKDAWSRLAEESGNPLLNFEWFSSAIDSFCDKNKINVIVLRENNRIKAIAPMEIKKRFGFKHFEISGSSVLMEPTSLICEDNFAFKKLWDKILDLRKPLILKRLIIPSSLAQPLIQMAKEKSFIVIENLNSSQWIPIETSWEEFERKMKSSQRTRFRRLRKKFKEKGTIEINVYKENNEEFRNALDDAFRIEASGWKTKQGTAINSNKKLKKFFTAYINSALKKGIVRLFLLKINGKAIAMILGLVYGQGFWILKVGYDEEWSKYAPGIVLQHESIRWAFENQLKSFEFLGMSEPWIKSWTNDEHIYFTFRLFPKTFNGLCCMLIESVTVISNKILKRLLRIIK